jgi:FkbM family methyltransferase
MNKIFIDVGAHVGQTASVVADQKYGFSSIYCFEPVSECVERIQEIPDSRIVCVPFGMSNRNGTATIFSPGTVGATIFAGKSDVRNELTEEIGLIHASEWVNENIGENDIAFMKLNCEGAECDVLDDLIETQKISRLYSVMVDFDVRKIPAMRFREKEIRKRIRNLGLHNVCYSDDVMFGPSHRARLEHWLGLFGAEENLDLASLRNRYQHVQAAHSRKPYLPKPLRKIWRKLRQLHTS